MKKVRVFLTQDELRLAITCINDLRNRLIAEGRYTDAVDGVLLKAMTAPTKKVKIA